MSCVFLTPLTLLYKRVCVVKATALEGPPYYHVPRFRGTLLEAGGPAAGAARGKNRAAGAKIRAAGSIF